MPLTVSSQANYAAAKAGILGLTKSAAREGQKYNVVINVVRTVPSVETTRKD